MKKMWKRFVSLLLACTLLAGMLPLSASAAGEPTDSQWITEKIEEINAGLEQGEQYHRGNYYKLGDSDLYRLTFTRTIDTETATITDAVIFIVPGTDANENNSSIPDYNSLGETPWEESSASAVYIADGVTGIGNHAFDGMSTLETLEIQNPDSLTRIGDYAFNGCDQLQGTDGKLDLSGVTEMGSHAFNGCERLDTVTLGDGLTEIPEYAFNGCGLTSVNIPEKVTSIGNSAFANNSLSGELNLPSSLITIGERAFYRYNSSSPTGGFSSITIPSSVMEIGANAFSGHKSLETVTLEHENKEKLTIENGAFGTDTYTAHNYLDSIKVGDITYENVSMGTQFLTKNNVGELLNNGVNCYLGDLKPLKFDHTDLPTCLTPGYRYYEMTLEGASTENEPIVVETKIEIPAPDHSYVECEDLPATCTQPERTHEHCTNLDKGLVRSCEEEEKIRIKEGGKRALGHNYVVTDIENPTIGAGAGDTVITYTCQNWSASEDKNLHDGDNISPSYSWKIEDKAVVGSTAHTLEELNLPVVQGVGNNYYAHLEWAVDDETLEAPLEDGTHPYNVKLVVTGAGLTFPECTGIGDQLLQVTVQVDKIKLDFSQVEFQNNIRYVAQPNGVFGVLNLPEDAEIVKTEYSQNGDTWAGEAPEETEGNVGKYQVRVTFSYTSSKYLLDTEDKALQPPAGYTLAAGDKLGTGTLTGPYEIKQLTKDDLSVSSIPGLTYNGSKRNTVRIVGLPKDAKVTVTWKDAEGAEKEEIHTATETSMDVAGIINAGTYDVTIKVEHETFANGSAEITAQGVIAKKSIPIPEANTLGSYTPEKVQIGVNDPTGEYVGIYTVDNNKQINAGTYEATAILLAPNNYKWSTSEGAAVNISYTIPRRVVQKPGVTSSTYTFTGQPIEVLYRTNQERLDGKYDDSGKLTAYWKDYDTEYVVYTATDVKKTDAGDYKVTVALNNKDANNYWWAGEDAEDYSFTWTINPQSINAPAVKVNNTTYDGQPYNTGGSDITLTGQSEVLVLGEDHKFYSNQSSSDPMQEAPTNAGTYYVQVDFDFKGDLNPDNYTITGNNRQRFTIKKAELTLTEPTENLSVTYTGSDQTVPPPTVEGLQGDDTASDYSLVYTYTIGESKVTQSQTGELKLSQVGTYHISVSVSQECTNYTSNTVEYEFTISTANQTVKLTQEGGTEVADGGSISKTLGDVPFTVTGKGYVNDVVVNEDDIGYEVTGGDTQNPVVEVDPTRGEVTLLRAGRATITVTAAGSANYGEATASYTITVGKGTPEVAVQMPTGGSADNTYSYTGEALTFNATVTGASNGAVAPTTDRKVTYNFYSDNSGQKGDALANQPTGIGTYWVEAVYEGDDNYNGLTSTAEKFTISPAALNVTATGYDAIYNGQKYYPVKSITVTGVNGVISSGYTISYAKKTDGQTDAPEATSDAWKTDTQVKDVADSGDYWFKVVIDEDDSYNAYIGSVKVTIDPKQLTVTKTVKPTKEYDGTADATKNVEINSIDTGIEGEKVTADLVSAVYNSPNANEDNFITITYQLAGEGTNLANYTVSTDGGEITDDGLGTETVKVVDGTPVGIIPAPITVAINDQKKVYDGSVATPSQSEWSVDEEKLYDVDDDGIKDDLGITLTVVNAKNAGKYAITGTANNSNYAVTFTGNWAGEGENKDHAGTYTIEPRPINVQIGNAEGFYGDEPVLNNVALDDVTGDGVSGAGLVVGEVLKDVLKGLELATAANAQSDISNEDTPYTIYAKNGEDPILAPTQLGNYNVTFTNEGTYTVKQRPITITIKDHSSKYGAAIDDGITTPLSGTDYTVAITEGNTVTTDGAIVNGDDLGIALSTTAKKGDNAGTYSISGKVSDGDVSENYSITWAGETSWNGSDQDSTAADSAKGTYTIDKAQLKVSVNRSDIYAQYGEEISNPVTFTNESTGQKIASDASDYTALSQAITYGMEPQGGLTQVEGSQKAEGKFTVAVTQQMVTVTVNVAATENYEAATEITYHIHASASGSLDVSLPFADLTYNGQPQQLLAQAPELPDGVYIRYKVGESGEWTAYSDKNQDNWKEVVGENAGSYTVYWETTSSGNYNASSGNSNTSIAKATLEGSFAQKEYTHVLTKGNSYDSATANELTISSAGYGAEPAKYTYRSADTTVAMAENGGSTIRIMGSAGQETTITVTVPGDDNYNGKTFTYTLEISEKLSEIKYSVENDKVTYNGQPQTIAVNVTAPASGATVRYWNESTNAYDQTEPPAYTDVQDSGTTIKFQITAPGYKTVTDEATLTIKPRDINLCQVEGIAESYTFVNKPIEPQTVEVVDGSVILTKNTDYTLEYGANQEVGEDTGTVIIKGTGNYTGEVIEHFDIIPVDGSSGITASIAPNFGTYDPDAPVTAEVTVTHQTGSESHNVDLTAANAEYTISATDLVTGQTITDHGATGTGGTLTFTKPAIYDITLTLTGDHRGEFRLSYTLLPLSNDDGGLTLTVDDETQKVFTYGDEIDSSGAAITVTADGNIVTDQCTLTYVYTPFEGTPTTTASPYTAEVLKNAGVYTVTATPTDGSAITGTGTFTFLILQRDLSEANLTVEDSGLVYNQKAQMPSVTVAANGDPVQGTDYTITYYNNVNASDAAKAVVTAKGNNFTGSQTAEFTIAPKEITDEMVKEIPEQYYTGNAVIPPVTITDGNYTLILGYDYTTACEDKGPGAATVTIKGTGNYTETTTKDFVIKSEGAPEPSERFDLVVTPSQWTWGDDLTNLRLSVTFGTDKELTLGTEYTLSINNEVYGDAVGETKEQAIEAIKNLKPGEYTITATGVGAYNGSTDTETVTIQKIQPTVTVTATPNSLSGGGKVTLTLKGEKLPAFAKGEDLSDLLTVTVQNGQQAPDLTELEWTENPDGSLTAELTLPNTNETYTFALSFVGNDCYESASSNAMVVVGQQTSGGGGGSDPGDQPADPDDTGVSDWLNTKDHLAYLAGYPGGTFGPDQNMTRAEAAQMFYNLLLEKDVEITVEFEDVPADAWYAKPVNTLASLGILSGVGNGRFDPERSITRAEFTVIAMKFANTSGGGVNIFSDVNEDDWFYSAVVDSTQYGWINGYPDGTFRPEATISRAEVTVIVNHMLGRAADRPYVIAHEEELNTFGDVNRGHWGYFHVAEATNAHEYHTEDGTESWTGLS